MPPCNLSNIRTHGTHVPSCLPTGYLAVHSSLLSHFFHYFQFLFMCMQMLKCFCSLVVPKFPLGVCNYFWGGRDELWAQLCSPKSPIPLHLLGRGASVIFAHQFLVKRLFAPSSGTKSQRKKATKKVKNASLNAQLTKVQI